MNLFDLLNENAGDSDVAPGAWQNDGIPDGSRWLMSGRAVIVRGASPACVWFSEPDASQLTQTTIAREDFLKKAKRQEARP